MKIGYDNALKIEIISKIKNSTISTLDEIFLPLQVVSKPGSNKELAIEIELCKTEQLKKIIEAINSNIDNYEFIQIKVGDKEPIVFEF